MSKQQQVTHVLINLLAIGQLPECRGADGSSPVAKFQVLVAKFGCDEAANQLVSAIDGVNNGCEAPLCDGLKLHAWPGILSHHRPINLEVVGPQAENYGEFVRRANDMLTEQSFQPVI